MFLRKAFGYPVVIEDASLNTTTTVVQTSFTTPLFILPIAATVTFVAAFMTGPYHYFVKALAILLSMGATFAELVLFNSVKKEVPRLGSLAVISQASGSSISLSPSSINPFSPSNLYIIWKLTFCRSLLSFAFV